jgi:uncharacterized membrane protein HdeD (DUF308 family)
MTTLTVSDIGRDMRRVIGSVWGWFVALGVVLMGLGALAFNNLPAATAATVYAVGILMLIGAVAQVGIAFRVRGGSGFGLMLLSALLYGVAGVVAIANPALAAKALTLLLAFGLIFSGVMRIWWSTVMRFLPGWGWITASGIVSVLAGMVFIAGWPANSLWFLGLVLAVDLTFQGASAIGWGIGLKGITS